MPRRHLWQRAVEQGLIFAVIIVPAWRWPTPCAHAHEEAALARRQQETSATGSSTAVSSSALDMLSPVLDSPGLYEMIHGNTIVRRGPSLSLASVGELANGTIITVVEILVSTGRDLVYGRIEVPMAGWLSLLNTSSGHRWAVKVLSADSETARTANISETVEFGEWWHWLSLILLFVLLAMLVAVIARCALLRWRQAAKSEDEVVPFNKSVLPESDDEQLASAPANISTAGSKVVPMACQDASRLEIPESHTVCEASAETLRLESVESHSVCEPTLVATAADAAAPQLSPARVVDSPVQMPAADGVAEAKPRATSPLAHGPSVQTLPAPTLDQERSQESLHEDASQFLRAALECDSLDTLRTAIASARVAGVPEAEVWFAEVCCRRRAAVADLAVLLLGEAGPLVAPQWKRLWAAKASIMRDLLARAKSDPEAVLSELRLQAEAAGESWNDEEFPPLG